MTSTRKDTTAPYDGIVPLLDRLRGAGVKLGVVSSKEDHLTRQVIGQYFPGVFDDVRGHVLGTPTKTGRIWSMKCAPPSVWSPGRCCMQVTAMDMFTARNAGLDGCGVLWGFRTAQETERPAHAIWSPRRPSLEALVLEPSGTEGALTAYGIAQFLDRYLDDFLAVASIFSVERWSAESSTYRIFFLKITKTPSLASAEWKKSQRPRDRTL